MAKDVAKVNTPLACVWPRAVESALQFAIVAPPALRFAKAAGPCGSPAEAAAKRRTRLRAFRIIVFVTRLRALMSDRTKKYLKTPSGQTVAIQG
jgi:hypothetical protein